jgi:sporulation protein YlmC with PRC-barrel domain
LLHNTKKIKSFGIKATDGEIGTVHDLLFTDDKWTTRHLVVDTMKWLPGRKVLLSPMSIDQVNTLEDQVKVLLDKEKIKNSPDIDTDKPVSRAQETILGKFYGLYPYWHGAGYWGPYWNPYDLAHSDLVLEGELEEGESYNDIHLRSVNEVVGYQIEALDGSIGHVEDFIISEETWQIKYLVIDTQNWWPGKKVLVSTDWIQDVRWTDRSVKVELTKDVIKSGPEYTPDQIISSEFEDEKSCSKYP